MTNTTTYTATNFNTGEIIGTGLSLEEAAIERLTYEGDSFELVQENGESRIQGKARSGKVVIFYDGPLPRGRQLVEWRGTAAEQRQKLFERVISADWSNVPVDVMTDADYAAEQKRMAEEDVE